MTRQEMLGEITACKSLLSETDYTIIKTLEGLMSCTSATGIISYLKEITGELLALKNKRQGWRDTINELEAQIAALGAEEIEVSDGAETAESYTDTESVESPEIETSAE